MSAPQTSEWIEWNGGICPVDVHTMVEYRLRWFKPQDKPFRCMAGYCRWDHGRTPEAAKDASARKSDIIAYRTVQS